MPRALDAILGKQFVHPATKEGYGLFRIPDGAITFSTLDGQRFSVIVEDGVGNYVTQLPDGSIWFWDHETDALERLADSLEQFVAGCSDPEPVNLNPSQVKSAWVDPALARSFGNEVAEDGWIKKKS